MHCNASMPWYLVSIKLLYWSSHSRVGRRWPSVGSELLYVIEKQELVHQLRTSLFQVQSILGLCALSQLVPSRISWFPVFVIAISMQCVYLPIGHTHAAFPFVYLFDCPFNHSRHAYSYICLSGTLSSSYIHINSILYISNNTDPSDHLLLSAHSPCVCPLCLHLACPGSSQYTRQPLCVL